MHDTSSAKYTQGGRIRIRHDLQYWEEFSPVGRIGSIYLPTEQFHQNDSFTKPIST